MTEFEIQKTAAHIEARLTAVVGKVFLIVMGLIVVISAALDSKATYRWAWLACGAIPLGLAVYWIIIDKRVKAPDEELEDLLVDASKKIRRAGSMPRLIEEYRVSGADELTLCRIRNAPHLLGHQGQKKLSIGIALSAAGLILGLAGIILVMWKGDPLDKHVLKYGFLGAGLGLGYIAQGLRFKWCARRFHATEKPPVIKGAPPISSRAKETLATSEETTAA